MDDDVKELIEEASEYIDEDGRSSFDHAQESETLLSIIIDNLNFSRREYGLSENAFERALRKIIGQIDSSDDVESKFQNLLGSLKKEVGTSEPNDYVVTFALPLNVPKEEDHKFTIHGLEVEQITEESWKNDVLEKAKQESLLELRIERSPYEFSEDGTYWQTCVSGLDPDFAIERTRHILRTLLAVINYLHFRRQITHLEVPTSNPWPERWSNIVPPFAMFVFKDDNYVKAEFSDNVTPRDPVDIDEEVIEEVNNLPDFGSNKFDIDDQLTSGLHFFLDGITNPKKTSSFLDFWRALEILTLSKPGDSSSDITDRAKSFINVEDEHLFETHISRIVDVRNDLVHGDPDVDVVQADLNILKELTESLLSLYMNKRDDWSESDMKFVIHNCSVGEKSQLKQQKEARIRNQERLKNEIGIIDELINVEE